MLLNLGDVEARPGPAEQQSALTMQSSSVTKQGCTACSCHVKLDQTGVQAQAASKEALAAHGSVTQHGRSVVPSQALTAGKTPPAAG